MPRMLDQAGAPVGGLPEASQALRPRDVRLAKTYRLAGPFRVSSAYRVRGPVADEMIRFPMAPPFASYDFQRWNF